ncbi:MAG: hypothetical protein H6551_04005 [Chitinophagales bacterium]|nr:hypothetical protein [Bacteroidota bacterium]MCB9064288.1 hypothetical protein [Chitinophagales bacterium]
MEYIRFTKEIHMYLIYSGVKRLIHYGRNEHMDDIPKRIDNKEVHLLHPMMTKPNLSTEKMKRMVHEITGLPMEKMHPYQYDYDIYNELLEIYYLDFKDKIYLIPFDRQLIERIDYPNSFNAWKTMNHSRWGFNN